MSVTNDQVAALYAAVFNRAPDQEGLNFWVGQDNFVAIAEGFVAHPVFEAEYGEKSNLEFVQSIYENVLNGQGDAEGIDFWVNLLDNGATKGEFLASFLDAALGYEGDDADALLRQQALENKVTVGLYYTETLGEATNFPADADVGSADIVNSPVYQKAAAAIENVTADPETVEAAKAEIDREAEGNEPDTLTEMLAALQTSNDDAVAALTGAAEALNEAGQLSTTGAALAADDSLVEPLEGSALEDAVDAFVDAADFETAIGTLESDVATQQSLVDGAISALSGARATAFGAATASAVTTFTATLGTGSSDISYADLGLTSGSFLTDANIAKALSGAQKVVNGSPDYYTLTSAGTSGAAAATAAASASGAVTAKGLQSALIAAESTLSADQARNGSDAALLTDLRQALTNYLNADGTQGSAAISGASVTSVSTLLDDVNKALGTTTASDDATLVQQLTAASGEDGMIISDGGTPALRDAINSALEDINARAENYASVQEAEWDFGATPEGKVYLAADALVEWRDGQKQAVETAEQTLTDMQDLLSAVQDFESGYDDAQDARDEALQAFEDAGYEAPVEVSGNTVATAEDDIFLFVENKGGASTISNFGAEGEDTLFAGDQFTFNLLDVDADLATERLGSFDTLEVFAQQGSNGTTLYFESEAATGSDLSLDGFTSVTLIGVNAEDIIFADGYITVA